jgi:hypothetical protein
MPYAMGGIPVSKRDSGSIGKFYREGPAKSDFISWLLHTISWVAGFRYASSVHQVTMRQSRVTQMHQGTSTSPLVHWSIGPLYHCTIVLRITSGTIVRLYRTYKDLGLIICTMYVILLYMTSGTSIYLYIYWNLEHM